MIDGLNPEKRTGPVMLPVKKTGAKRNPGFGGSSKMGRVSGSDENTATIGKGGGRRRVGSA